MGQANPLRVPHTAPVVHTAALVRLGRGGYASVALTSGDPQMRPVGVSCGWPAGTVARVWWVGEEDDRNTLPPTSHKPRPSAQRAPAQAAQENSESADREAPKNKQQSAAC